MADNPAVLTSFPVHQIGQGDDKAWCAILGCGNLADVLIAVRYPNRERWVVRERGGRVINSVPATLTLGLCRRCAQLVVQSPERE